MNAERIRRGRSVRRHVMWALLVLLVLIPVNFLTSPQYPWWIWALMAWMPVVAGHSAWAMRLFDRKKERS
jgi:uncharacterized membrane protein YdbT with pleckstrin-like domain